MVSLDIKSLFTNVPLEATFDISLEKLYERNAINTLVSKTDMKQFLTLCTKDMHFTYDDIIY